MDKFHRKGSFAAVGKRGDEKDRRDVQNGHPFRSLGVININKEDIVSKEYQKRLKSEDLPYFQP